MKKLTIAVVLVLSLASPCYGASGGRGATREDCIAIVQKIPTEKVWEELYKQRKLVEKWRNMDVRRFASRADKEKILAEQIDCYFIALDELKRRKEKMELPTTLVMMEGK